MNFQSKIKNALIQIISFFYELGCWNTPQICSGPSIILFYLLFFGPFEANKSKFAHLYSNILFFDKMTNISTFLDQSDHLETLFLIILRNDIIKMLFFFLIIVKNTVFYKFENFSQRIPISSWFLFHISEDINISLTLFLPQAVTYFRDEVKFDRIRLISANRLFKARLLQNLRA